MGGHGGRREVKERTDGGGEIKRRDWRGEVSAGWVKKKKHEERVR